MYMFRALFSQDTETRLLQAWYGNFFESLFLQQGTEISYGNFPKTITGYI
jgi:hypothetical protein